MKMKLYSGEHNKYILFRMFLVLMTSLSFSNCYSFEMFIHTGYKNIPDFSEYGFTKSDIVYEQEIYKGNVDRSKKLSTPQIGKLVSRLKINPPGFVMLDIEYWLNKWRYNDNKQKLTIAQRYSDTVQQLKKISPEYTIGYFGVVPAWAHWNIISSEKKYKQWQIENDMRQIIADSVDVVYPSLYTYHENPDDWKLWTTAILTKAKSMAKGKKVIPFIWPRYHQSSKPYKNGKSLLPAKYWRTQLQLVGDMADGFVIWDGAFGNKGEWDENAPWWQETKIFIANNFPDKIKSATSKK